MAWCWPGNKSLFEPMMVSLLRHKCMTLPQWVKVAVTVMAKVVYMKYICAFDQKPWFHWLYIKQAFLYVYMIKEPWPIQSTISNIPTVFQVPTPITLHRAGCRLWSNFMDKGGMGNKSDTLWIFSQNTELWNLWLGSNKLGSPSLTHCGLMTPYGDRDLGQHWLR